MSQARVVEHEEHHSTAMWCSCTSWPEAARLSDEREVGYVRGVYFTFTEFSATYRVVRPFRIPPPHYCGSMLRGVFGRALREASCSSARDACASACMTPETCAYTRLFDPLPPPKEVTILGSPKDAPKPLVFLVPEFGRGTFERGETFVFGVRVLGRLDEFDESRIVEALRRVSERELGSDRGRIRVDDVRRLGPREQRPCLPRFDPRPRGATIHVKTPMWIQESAKECSQSGSQSPELLLRPTFYQLFVRISWRLTTVCQLYGEYQQSDQERFAALVARSKQVDVRSELIARKWRRQSWERDQSYNLRGVLGTIRLRGELAPFVDYLYLAQYAHIGKSANVGLGRVRVDFSE